MISEALKNVIEFRRFEPVVQSDLNIFLDFYDSIYDQTQTVLTAVKNTYNFDRIHCYFPGATGDIHLEFATGPGLDPYTVICLNNGGNVAGEPIFGAIIEECPAFMDFSEKTLAHAPLPEHLFYTWFAWLWQEIGGHETGLKVRIIDAQASRLFSLNDFAWGQKSAYFAWHEVPERVPFQSHLTLPEIYRRVARKN